MVDENLMRTRIVIVGAGFAGIGLGIKLKKSGLNDFIILEKSDSVGGVWRDNHYPGAACDVPSHLYSFSFEPRADWPQKYATQPEILDYLNHCTWKYGLAEHIRFRTEVTNAQWNAASFHWIVRTNNGHVFETQSLVTATGQLSRPFRPQLPGLANFTGVVFHSAEWPRDYDLRDKHVAVIGTGASAVQFVPAIASLVKKLYVFQRSAPFILPKQDKTYSPRQKFIFKKFRGLLQLSRLFIYIKHEMTAFSFVTFRAALRVKRGAFFRHLRKGITDSNLRGRLIPNYRMGCKRILLSNDFYPAMNRPNVELVTEDIKELRTDSIISADAKTRYVDCIIFGTGFSATDFLSPIKITGSLGQDLHKAWENGAEAHLGMTIAGFPNFFMLYGPNTNLAHNSIIYMIENQIRYVMTCLMRLCRDEIRSLDIKKKIQHRFNADLRKRLDKSQWSKGCTSWYLTAARRNTTNWPGYSLEFRLRTHAPKWDDYAIEK